MESEYLLTLSGSGYLHDIFKKGSDVTARIKTITCYDIYNDSQDDVWINCRVDNLSHFCLLNQYINLVREGNSIIITYQVKYSTIGTVFSGVTPEDNSNQILTVYGKLISLGDCFINGSRLSTNMPNLLSAA
jgi:hypothetical protein